MRENVGEFPQEPRPIRRGWIDEGGVAADRAGLRGPTRRSAADQHGQAQPRGRRPRRAQEGKAPLGSLTTNQLAPGARPGSDPDGSLGWDVPELIVYRDDRAGTMPPGRLASKAQVWRDHDGTVAAYGYTERGRHTMAFPHLGAFRFTGTTGEPVEARILPHVGAEVVEDAYRRMVLPMV